MNAGFINPTAGSLLVANNLSEIAAAGASAQASARTNLGLGTTGTMQLDYLGLGVARTAGRLQFVAGTTPADGAVFGTDSAIYRAASGQMYIDHIGGTSPTLGLSESGSARAYYQYSGGSAYLGTTGAAPLILRVNNINSVTIDTSQRLILSGALRLNNAHVAGAPAATGYVTVQDSAGNTMKLLCSNV